MKKIVTIFTILLMFSFVLFTGNVYADSLDTIDVEVNKTTIRPGEEVTVTINFGQELGSYTFEVAYDNDIFEYVSAEGGTANDTSDKVRVVFHDSSGGTSPRSNMSVTFKAKEDITTSNPTEFMITGEGLANSDASVNYDDIVDAIVKNVTVEPEYIDYTIKLEYTGEIIKQEAKEMTLSYSSPMGKYYEKARLIAEATTPDGASVQLIGKDQSSADHDLIQSGWGDSQGYKIGGKDVSQVLNLQAIFSEAGDYTITLKLIDRENSDQTIAEETFFFKVNETATVPSEPETTPEDEQIPSEEENPVEDEEVIEEEIAELPQTGINMYIPFIIVLSALICSCVYYNKRKK